MEKNKVGRPKGKRNKEQEYADDLLKLKIPTGVMQTSIANDKGIRKQQLNTWKKNGVPIQMVATYDLWDYIDYSNIPWCYHELFDRMLGR